MDMLEQFDGNENSDETTETKVMLDEIQIKGQPMDSDDDTNVEHLSPQTLLETSADREIQYSVRSPQGVITYRVLQVEDNNTDNLPQIVTTGSASFGNQVLTSNVNGQLYVIGGSSEVFTTPTGARAIAPRTSVLETKNSVISNIRKRDERRRATHNEVERRRRDKINNWISKLASIIPESPSSEIKANHYDGLSKGGILAKACDYITELNDVREKHQQLLKEHKELQQNLEMMKAKNSSLDRENTQLKTILRKHKILFVSSEMVS